MRRIATIICVLAYCASFSQETEKTKKTAKIENDWDFRAYTIYPIQFGDHSLAKAHDHSLGFGLSLSPVSYHGFSFSAGWEYVSYDVTDHLLVGNFENSNYTSLFGSIKYKLPVSKSIEFYPAIGFGYAVVKQRTKNTKFGSQDGTEFRLGFTGNYRVSKVVSFFLGAHFIYNRFEINTNEDYQKFFGQANQLQISAGIQLD
jgi:hypothetical protein